MTNGTDIAKLIVLLPADLRREFKAVTAKAGVSMAEVIRHAIVTWLSEQKAA